MAECDTKVLASRLGVSRRTVLRYVHQGVLQPVNRSPAVPRRGARGRYPGAMNYLFDEASAVAAVRNVERARL